MTRPTQSPGPFPPPAIRLGIARGITYGLFRPPDPFVAPLRGLGAGLVRVYVYWNQVEPEPGMLDWSIVDSFLEQLTGDEEVWVTVCSSSRWATRAATDFLPPSSALDAEVYSRFVHALVSHCAGRVQYWQCNNEPSNVPLLWSGTAAEYVAQLSRFHRAVRAADPSAAVVLGGCGYDVLASAPDGPAREFFDHVVAHGRDLFDLFALHLYDSPKAIPAHVQTARAMMRAHGYERPIVVGEYNGPTLFEFPELDAVLQQTMMRAFAGTDAGGSEGDGDRDRDFSTQGLSARVDRETPERRALRALYDAMPTLPPRLQMFMAGCAPELDERRDRINCREIVTRNLFALSAGVHRTVCWLLAPEVANYEDPFTMMELMHGKLPLLGYDGERIGRTRPAAETFRLLASLLEGAASVTRLDVDARAEVFGFVVDRGSDREPLVVLWADGDPFSGEDDDPVRVTLPWSAGTAFALDAFGSSQPVAPEGGELQISVSVTPMFVSSAPIDASRRDLSPLRRAHGRRRAVGQ